MMNRRDIPYCLRQAVNLPETAQAAGLEKKNKDTPVISGIKQEASDDPLPLPKKYAKPFTLSLILVAVSHTYQEVAIF